MFEQLINPTGDLAITCLLALVPVVLLLFLLAGLRLSAWIATIIGSAVTIALAFTVWRTPAQDIARSYVYGSATGVWNVDWIVLWGVMLFNTLTVTGLFENFRRWLITQGPTAPSARRSSRSPRSPAIRSPRCPLRSGRS